MTRPPWASRAGRLVVAALLALAVVGPAESASPGHEGSPGRQRPAVPDEILVGFRAGVTPAEQGRRSGEQGPLRRNAPAASGASSLLPGLATGSGALRADPRVRYAGPNYRVHAADHGAAPGDPAFHSLWGLHYFGQAVNGVRGSPDADVDAPEAWTRTNGSAEAIVGVIDTGIDLAHPDLAAPCGRTRARSPATGSFALAGSARDSADFASWGTFSNLGSSRLFLRSPATRTSRPRRSCAC